MTFSDFDGIRTLWIICIWKFKIQECSKMKPFAVFVIVLVSGLCLGTKKATDYMDSFLSTAFANEVLSLDTGKKILAPNFEFKFEEDILLGKVGVKASFENGRLGGLEKARRQSTCRKTGHQAGANESETFSCNIAFDKLIAKYDGKIKYGKLPGKSIRVEAEISDTLFLLEIVQENSRSFVNKFACTKKGTAKFRFTRLGLFKRFLKQLENGFNKHLQATLFDAMVKKLPDVINRALCKDRPQLR